MAAKGPARASLRYAKAPLSPRYQWELHQLLGHCYAWLSQDDLASMIVTNRRFISGLERGKGTSYLGSSLATAEALGINISILFEGPRTTLFSSLPKA